MSEFQKWESKKKNWRERHWVKWWRSRKKNAELFDLCKRAVAMKQIKIASPAKDRKKLLEEKLRTSQGKFP